MGMHTIPGEDIAIWWPSCVFINHQNSTSTSRIPSLDEFRVPWLLEVESYPTNIFWQHSLCHVGKSTAKYKNSLGTTI
jgi:hypothetical protein